MHATKLMCSGAALLALGGCAAATQVAMDIESRLSARSEPVIQTLQPEEKWSPSDRPLYSDLYEMEGRYNGGLVRLNQLQSHLDRTLDEVKHAAGYPQFEGKVFVLSEPNALHAQASREGNIFISLGFLRNIKTQEELSNLIAHEFAHIALQHHKSDAFGNMNAKVVAAMNAMTKLSVLAASYTDQSDASSAQLVKKGADAIEKARFVQELVSKVVSPSWGRQQELEADQLAADISVRLNHDYSKAYLWMARLSKLHGTGNFENIQVNRVNARYVEQMTRNHELAENDNKKIGERIEGMVYSLAYTGMISAIDYFAKTHSDPKHRIRLVKEYYGNFYPDAFPDQAPGDAWAKVLSSPELVNTVEAYLLADRAVEEASDPTTRKHALNTMRQAERLRSKGHVYVWSRKVTMYELLNDRRKMQASLDQGATAGMSALVPSASARSRLNVLLQADFAQPKPEVGSAPVGEAVDQARVERLALIRAVQNELALPVFDERNRRLPNIQMLLLKSDLMVMSGNKKEARALRQDIFETYQRPGFVYPRLIVDAGTDTSSDLARLEAEKLNLECAFLHPEQADLCQNALLSL